MGKDSMDINPTNTPRNPLNTNPLAKHFNIKDLLLPYSLCLCVHQGLKAIKAHNVVLFRTCVNGSSELKPLAFNMGRGTKGVRVCCKKVLRLWRCVAWVFLPLFLGVNGIFGAVIVAEFLSFLVILYYLATQRTKQGYLINLQT